MAGSIYTVDQAASGIVAGTVALADTAAHPLVASPAPCKRVWVGRPKGETNDVYVGTAARCGRLLAAADTSGFYIHIDDASKLSVQAAVASANVEYWIEN